MRKTDVHRWIKIRKTKRSQQNKHKVQRLKSILVFITYFLKYPISSTTQTQSFAIMTDRGKIFDRSLIKHSQEHVLYTVIKV